MADYKPSGPFSVPAFLSTYTTEIIKGVKKKIFTENEEPFFCSFRTFGGTEKVVNDVLVVEDTATLETWYDPTIKAGCIIRIDNCVYEILGTPENINQRNQYLVFKVKAIKGGA